MDDVLDVRGDEAALGKRVGQDLERGKLTFPALLGLDEERPTGRRARGTCDRRADSLGAARRGAGAVGAVCSGKGVLMDKLLSQIESPRDMQGMSVVQLNQLAGEIREALCNLVSHRTAHFASNLGVVELCLALHTTFDFSRDRLIWDTGHQVYPHKLVTGRYHELPTMRTKGGLMGYPNPAESEYDLFMTGHAGCSVSTALGLKLGDAPAGRRRPPRRGRYRRWCAALGHRVRGLQQRRRPQEQAAGRVERQQDVHLPAGRRPGSLPGTAAAEPAVHGFQARSLADHQGKYRSWATPSSGSSGR